MSIRNLDHLFRPKSIVLIGATTRTGSVGGVLARNLLTSGFVGPIMPVTPNHESIQGVLAYPDIDRLPITPDLAVIATKPETVPGIVDGLGKRGTKAAVVISAGFGEGDNPRGHELQRAMLAAARPHLLRIVGPNCLGILVPKIGLNASFAHRQPQAGKLAFVAQSGALVTGVLDWAAARDIGFSHLVSVGDMADVDFGDMLDYLALDGDTGAILLYIEAVTQARKFMSAARAAARTKPVIVIKSGRHEPAAKAASSHTGALAGSDAVYDAAFRRAGMLRVYTIDELFDAVETLAFAQRPPGDRLAIVTNGGGFGVLAADDLGDKNGRLAPLAPETMTQLNALLPASWSHGNPVDIIGDADGKRYAAAIETVLADPNTDGVLVLNCPTAVASGIEAAQATVDAVERVGRGKNVNRCVITSWLGAEAAAGARRLFAQHAIPTYDTPRQAVRAFMQLVEYRRNQDALAETPAAILDAAPPDSAAARAIVERALAGGRAWLLEHEAKAVLRAYGIATVPTEAVGPDPEAAAAAARRLGFPSALKILSPDILHKSDAGGVALDLADEAAVREAAALMLRRIGAALPTAQLAGFTVQPTIRRPQAFELIVGVSVDELFGPVILVGHGGTAVEVLNDKSLGLPPLNSTLARDMIERTRVRRLLAGYRDRPAADLDSVTRTLVQVSQMAIDLPELAELDINPLLADASGVIALDARIRVRPAGAGAGPRLSISPYPSALEERIAGPGGQAITIRPIRPEDEPGIRTMFAKLSPEDVRMRFFTALKWLSHDTAARLTQIDYDREMALILCDREQAPGSGSATDKGEIWGVVRIVADPDNERAEFAVTVRSDATGRGLGSLLMEKIIGYARRRGIGEIFGRVLRDNAPMLKLAARQGFRMVPDHDDPGIAIVTLPLAAADGKPAS